MIKPESVPEFEEAWQTMLQENVRIVDLPELTPEQIGQLIVASASRYRSSGMAEIHDMTKIIDPATTIKD